MPTIADRIIELLEQEDEIQGVERLAHEHLDCWDKCHVIAQLRRLDAQGLIAYLPSHGGRGRMSIIRRRNPGQPGLPRKVRQNR